MLTVGTRRGQPYRVMSDMYWIAVGSEQKGPYTFAQIQSMWRSGGITADTLYWGIIYIVTLPPGAETDVSS